MAEDAKSALFDLMVNSFFLQNWFPRALFRTHKFFLSLLFLAPIFAAQERQKLKLEKMHMTVSTENCVNPKNPPNPETQIQISRYLTVQIQIETLF